MEKEFMKDSWFQLLEPVIKSYTPDIYKELSEKGGTILPNQELIYNAFNQFETNELKVVILGQDPYHTNASIPNGLSFSVGCDNYCPPSLRNVLLEIKSDKKNLDIDSAIKAKDYRDVWGVKQASQGVLLLNTALTVEQGKPGSHLKTWKKFTKEVIKSIMMTQADIVWLLWGRPAQKLYDECTDTIEIVEKLPLDPDWADWIKNCELGQYVHTLTDDLKSVNFHYSLRTSHPSPFSANNQLNDCPAFIGSNCFVNCNNILSEIGRNKIEW